MNNLILIKLDNEIIHKESDMGLEFITNTVLQEFPKSNFFIISPEYLKFIQYINGFQKINVNINAGLNLLYDKYSEFITNEVHNIILNFPFNYNQYNEDIDDFKNSISKPIVVDKWKYKIDWWRIYLMCKIDSSKNQKYLNWLCKVDFNNEIDYDEDRAKIYKLLEDFDKPQVKALIKKSGYSIDIMDYENNNDLFKIVNECYYSKLEDVEAGNRQILYKKRKVFEDKNWLVVVPESHEESVTIGRGTNWCTSADSKESERHYNNYTENGKKRLFIFINKHNNSEKYQWSEKTEDFLDWNDENFDIDIFDPEFIKNFYISNKNIPNNFIYILIQNNEFLYDFIKSENEFVRKKVAEQGYGLDILVHDKDSYVRYEVAKKGYGLDILVHDKDSYVKYEIVKQGYGLDILVHDKDSYVKEAAEYMIEQYNKGLIKPYINDYGFKCMK